MATFTTWILQLGNARAMNNAARVCQQRTTNEAHVAATCAELAERYDRPALGAAPAHQAVAARSAA